MTTDMLFKVAVVVARWLELPVHNLESVRDCVVLAFEGTEAGQDLVIYAFNEHDPIKRIEVLLLQVIVPHFNVDWYFGQVS